MRLIITARHRPGSQVTRGQIGAPAPWRYRMRQGADSQGGRVAV